MKTEVNGVTYEVDVNSSGMFFATHGDQQYSAERLSDLRKKLEQAQKADTSANPIPFVTLQGRRGSIRGRHAARRVLLVTWDDGTKGEVNSHETIFPGGVDEDVVDEMVKISAEKSALEERAQDLRRTWGVRADSLLGVD